jgi:hypothetical protein
MEQDSASLTRASQTAHGVAASGYAGFAEVPGLCDKPDSLCARQQDQGVEAMRAELEQRLRERWPTWFNLEGRPRPTLMSFSFAHGDGWFDLVWALCERLEAVVPAVEAETGRSFHVLQVKEKFGGLRFYTNYSNDTISALIETSEIESIHTCEVCGGPGRLCGTSWVETRCDEHANAA